MMRSPLYLRPDIQIEPLFDQWYAWPHLIPPATAARNVTERHMKIMDSYLNAPQVHAAAVANPQMLGGPFIDYGGKRVEEIRTLRDQTKSRRAYLFELSTAIERLDALLRERARGYSLEPLYQLVPEPLRGLVELVYDLNSHPSFRLIEPLIYRSKYFDRSSQSLTLSIARGDDRPFVLSTPRLHADDLIHAPVAYDDEVVDKLFRMKRCPRPPTDVREQLAVAASQEQLFASMFTDTPPQPYEPYRGAGVRWRYFGHACILVEVDGLSILLDPVLSYTYDSTISRYTYADLPDRIDFVLITHNHQDHILLETLLQIRHKVETIVVPPAGAGGLQDPSVRLLLNKIGFTNVLELNEMESIDFAGGRITGIPFLGEHADLNVRSKLAYLVRSGRHTLLFAADSCNVESKLYEHVHREIGDVSALFLGMECDGAPLSWLYGPLLTSRIERAMDESRRLSGSKGDQAIDIARRFGCKEAYVYAMGQEPWLNYIMSIKYTDQSRPIVESNRFLEDCASRHVHAERLFGEKEILLEV